MELKQNLIHRKYKKCEVRNQITIGDDYSVPEGNPDIASILQKKADLQVDEVHTEKGKVKLRGKLKICVLYLAQRSKEMLGSLFMEFPFDEILYMEEAASGDQLKIDWSIEDLRVTIIHPGKISVRALVTLDGEIMSVENQFITESIVEGAELHTKEGNFIMAEPSMEGRESYRIRDEIQLPANKSNVSRILWKDLQMRGLDLQIQEGRLGIKGELQLFVVYQGEDEQQPVQWLEQTMPFHGALDVSNLTPDQFGVLETSIAHQNVEVKPDYDGEMRMFQIELVLEIHMHIFEEKNCNYLLDAYSTKEKINLKSEEIHYEKLRMCNHTNVHISGREQLNEDVKVLQILGHHANVGNKRYKVMDQGILCEGTLEVQILYVTAIDNQPFGNVTMFVPYSQLVEVSGMGVDDRWNVSEKIEQIFITMQENNQIEVRGGIRLECCVMQRCSLQNVKEISSENYNSEEYKNRPGMTIHFVQSNETLWELAKKNLTTVEEIRNLNEFTSEEVAAGQKILLMKSAMMS